MSTIWVIVIVVLVMGFIVGNILLLQQTSKFKMPKVKKQETKPEDDDDSDW